MTDMIYLSDSYAKEFDGAVKESRGNTVILDRTAFFPGGGGQPFDTGELTIKNRTFKVVETRKDDEEVIHVVDQEANLQQGEKIHGRIDWGKRYMHMRLHTAIHIIDGIVERRNQGSITGGQIYDDRARVDFDIPGMDRAMAAEIIGESQRIADSSLKVYPKVFSREEALKIHNLSRTEPGRELMSRLGAVRTIVIEGFDMQMDGGTHVSNTREIGRIVLYKYENKGSHNKRVEIKLE